MTPLSKKYFTFCTGMGIYGFTRGYRADIVKNQQTLTLDKCLCGFMNSFFYTAPIFNIFQVFKLVNRVEIYFKNLNKDEYEYNYQEFIGICKDTV